MSHTNNEAQINHAKYYKECSTFKNLQESFLFPFYCMLNFLPFLGVFRIFRTIPGENSRLENLGETAEEAWVLQAQVSQ